MNWKQAFSLGLIAPGLWDGKGEPVAYLYNGVRLPKLPEWDKAKYPYAVIYRQVTGYTIWISNRPFTVSWSTRDIWTLSLLDESAVYKYTTGMGLTDSTGQWGEFSEENTGSFHLSSSATWANHDLLVGGVDDSIVSIWDENPDFAPTTRLYNGELYLSATDPIPVYE